MAKTRVAKVTISLPKAVLEYADRVAGARSVSRSEVVADLLAKDQESATVALMAQGYREMAEENAREAEELFSVAAESVLSDG